MLSTNGTVLVGDCTFADIQLEIGNSATEYEPYPLHRWRYSYTG